MFPLKFFLPKSVHLSSKKKPSRKASRRLEAPSGVSQSLAPPISGTALIGRRRSSLNRLNSLAGSQIGAARGRLNWSAYNSRASKHYAFPRCASRAGAMRPAANIWPCATASIGLAVWSSRRIGAAVEIETTKS